MSSAEVSSSGEAPASTEYKASDASSNKVSEIMATDADDESLRKYKESLLGAAAFGDLGDTSDPRRLIVTELRVIFDPAEGQEDIVHTLATPEGIEALKKDGISLKEGCKYKFQISFRVQHEIIAGVKFVNSVKKAVFSDKEELMIGSFPPASTPHVFVFPRHGYSEAPSGMLFRGKYTAKNSFTDSSGSKHLQYDYIIDIKKTW